jgi:hypothetical protein
MKKLLMDESEKKLKQKFNIQHCNTIIVHMPPTELTLNIASGSDQISLYNETKFTTFRADILNLYIIKFK